MFLSVLKGSNLALAFFLELGVLVSLGYWGFVTGPNILVKLVLGLGAPALAIVVWALFGAPTATWHLVGPWRLLLQILFFGSAAVALYFADKRTLGIIFALIFIGHTILANIWGKSK